MSKADEIFVANVKDILEKLLADTDVSVLEDQKTFEKITGSNIRNQEAFIKLCNKLNIYT